MEILAFPDNVVEVMVEEFAKIDGVDPGMVFDRPLESTDPAPSIAVVAADWMPNDFVIGQSDPAVSTYLILIQSMIKHTDKSTGIRQHSQLAKSVRMMLYRNQELRVRLTQLNETSQGIKERTQRLGIRQQRFLTNEHPQGTFLFLSTSEFWLETEAVPA